MDFFTLTIPWSFPGGSFSIGLDALSVFFLIPLFIISSLCVFYGWEYLKHDTKNKSLSVTWFFYALLVFSMALVFMARNAILFLIAWELMAVSSFFLVMFEGEKAETTFAGWIYLVATHLGTAFLLVMFVILGNLAGSLEFNAFSNIDRFNPSLAGLIFILAVIGFGAKAGIVPFHVWLPEAHPAAPSHVSALMSGIMIKTGIYGLLRILTYLGQPPLWWGGLLIGSGLVSGVLGILLALSQHDIKRLLAYSSVENIGLICVGLGIGMLGQNTGMQTLMFLGYAGALLHIFNHSLFKSLLFLGAGAVAHAAGTKRMDFLGGFLKKMPWTAGTFLIGAIAICGLPPLNGFVSEFFIYWGSLEGLMARSHYLVGLFVIIIGAGALIGGLAVACFIKTFGIVFLGESRKPALKEIREITWLMRLPMILLAILCLAVGICSPWLLKMLRPVLEIVMAQAADDMSLLFSKATEALSMITNYAVILLLLFLGIFFLRRWAVKNRPIAAGETWACGYLHPSARMQYTASLFTQPLTMLFRNVLFFRQYKVLKGKFFPQEGSFKSETHDPAGYIYQPPFILFKIIAHRLRLIQHGNLHLYILYIVITLIVLLIWKVGFGL